MAFTAGQKLRASELNDFSKRIVARNRRTTAKSTTATSTAAGQRIMTTSAEVEAGRLYRIEFNAAIKNSSANVRVFITLFYTTDGTEPTTTSTIMQQAPVDVGPNLDAPTNHQLLVLYAPASNHLLRVTPSLHGPSGTSTADAGAAVPMDLLIVDLGDDVGVSGTIY